MKTYPTLKAAQDAQDAGEVFSEIRRIADDEWQAFEPGDEIPTQDE